MNIETIEHVRYQFTPEEAKNDPSVRTVSLGSLITAPDDLRMYVVSEMRLINPKFYGPTTFGMRCCGKSPNGRYTLGTMLDTTEFQFYRTAEEWNDFYYVEDQFIFTATIRFHLVNMCKK